MFFISQGIIYVYIKICAFLHSSGKAFKGKYPRRRTCSTSAQGETFRGMEREIKARALRGQKNQQQASLSKFCPVSIPFSRLLSDHGMKGAC